ncbi:claudin-4-like [Neosynchiropus ocellatus]
MISVERAALAVAFVGWIASILTISLPLWTVSGTLGNTTASLPAYWDGVWLRWDHWDLANDGSLHCSFYRALMSLSGSFRTWRALILSAIVVGLGALMVGVAGAVTFPHRAWITVSSGVLFLLAGILLLVPTAWTCHHTSQPLQNARLLRRDWGPALFLAWISLSLMVVGGVFLLMRCRTFLRPTDDRGSPEEEMANHPLNRINRTTFTQSQLERDCGNT